MTNTFVQQNNASIKSTGASVGAGQLPVARQLLDSIHLQIRAADEKVRVLFSGTALLAAALAFSPPNSPMQTATGVVAPVGLAVAVLHGLLLLCVAGAVTSAIVALLPRVRPGHVERSLYFFGHIAATPHDEFIAEFDALPEETLLRQVLSQVHINSLIVSTKYVWTRRAATLFNIAVLLLVVKQGLNLFA